MSPNDLRFNLGAVDEKSWETIFESMMEHFGKQIWKTGKRCLIGHVDEKSWQAKFDWLFDKQIWETILDGAC